MPMPKFTLEEQATALAKLEVFWASEGEEYQKDPENPNIPQALLCLCLIPEPTQVLALIKRLPNITLESGENDMIAILTHLRTYIKWETLLAPFRKDGDK